MHPDLVKAEKPKSLTITVSVEILWSLLVYSTRPRRPFTSLTFVVFPEKIRAETTVLGQEEECFLDKIEPVWAPASACEGKVVGQHTYPFSITIPCDAMVAPGPKASSKRFSLPPTCSERASPAYIGLQKKNCSVTVRHGGRASRTKTGQKAAQPAMK